MPSKNPLVDFFQTGKGLVPVRSLDELRDAERIIVLQPGSPEFFTDFNRIQEHVREENHLTITRGDCGSARYHPNTKRFEYFWLLPVGSSISLGGKTLTSPDAITQQQIDQRIVYIPE